MLHTNIRSLTKNSEKLEELLSDIKMMPEIIAISETKLKTKFNSFIDGYEFIQNDSPTNAGGVGMFIRSLINFEKTTEYKLQVNGCEEIWVKVITLGCTKFFGVLYRHPNNNIKEYSKTLEKTLMLLNKQKLTYYICGNININLVWSDTSNFVKLYTDMMFSLRCIPLINHPTRFSQITATLLNQIYTNNVINKNTSHILTSYISDHLPVLVLINNTKQRVQDEAIYI